MRILIFNWRDITHPSAGGAESYLHEMAKRWVRKGHAIGWLCGGYRNSHRTETVSEIRIMRKGGKYSVYLLAPLYYLVRLAGEYDVVIDSENGIPFFTPLYVSVPKVLVIHHIHTEVFFKELRFPLSWLAYFLESKLMPLMYKKVKCITVSKSSKAEIEKIGLGRDGIPIIYRGVNLARCGPGEKSPDPLVAYIGRLKAYKSIDVLIRAVSKIVKELPNMKLVIVGSGSEQERLKRLVNELGIDQYVKFYGFVSQKEKIRIFQSAWVFVNPSFKEGWGATSIEASACGTPVLGSDVPGLRDSILNAVTGFLFKYGSVEELAYRLIQILKDGAMRTKLGKNGLKWAKKFSWNEGAEQSLRVLKELVGSKQTKHSDEKRQA